MVAAKREKSRELRLGFVGIVQTCVLRHQAKWMSLSKLPLWGYKQLVHVLQSQPFHSTPLLEGGRKTGSQALEAPFRRFSKKQLKRKANVKARLELKRDVGKEKLKAQHMEKKVHSPEFQEFVEKTNKL